MRKMTGVLAACAALALTACGDEEDPKPTGGGTTFSQQLQGTWTACDTGDAGSDLEITFVVNGSSYTYTEVSHGSTNLSCTGTGTTSYTESGTATIGTAANATLGSATVAAYPVDMTPSSGSPHYELAYIDASDRLHFGDTSGANDGSTAQLRPTSLSDTYLSRSTGSGTGGTGATAFATALQGTWRICYFDGTNDWSDVYAYGASSFSYAGSDHTTTNGTCGGTATPYYTVSGTYTIGAAVTTTLGSGGASVTAYKVNYVLAGSYSIYDLVYIDTAASPDRLYEGDSSTGDAETDATRPTLIDSSYYFTKQ